MQKYLKEEICEALLLCALSAKAYNDQRKRNFTFTLQEHAHEQNQVFLLCPWNCLIKLKLSTAELWERQCISMLDEMHVSQSYECCERLKGQASYGRNPKEAFHNTAYSVQLPYIASLSL